MVCSVGLLLHSKIKVVGQQHCKLIRDPSDPAAHGKCTANCKGVESDSLTLKPMLITWVSTQVMQSSQLIFQRQTVEGTAGGVAAY